MKIVIVGGGTSGWLTTLLFHRFLNKKGHTVINVSSKEIPIVGVGESTTFRFLQSLQKVGISFIDIFKGCDALPKLGIKFDGWAKTPGSFIGDIDGSHTSPMDCDYFLYHCAENNIPIEYAGVCGNQAYHGKTNFYINDDPTFLCDLDYNSFSACHIDTFTSGNFFKTLCKNDCVAHYDAFVEQVNVSEIGIESLQLSSGDIVSGDLYVDCTGFAKLLSKNLPGYEWDSYSKYLPLDSAIPFFRESDGVEEYHPYTTAKTMSSGWMWAIPSRNRIGRGYVYDSNFITESEAKKELESFFGEKLNYYRSPIKFNPGKQKKVFNKNCVSIGLSASFLEPLEATNIHCTVVQIENFINDCIINNNKEKYNSFCNTLFDSMRDFVAYHYTGGKEDTEFWKYVKTIERPDKVNQILEITKNRLLKKSDWESHDGQAGQGLWTYIAKGIGHISSDRCSSFIDYDKDLIKKEFDSYQKRIENTYKYNLTTYELNDYLKANK